MDDTDILFHTKNKPINQLMETFFSITEQEKATICKYQIFHATLIALSVLPGMCLAIFAH